jgi:hypothetical protein
MQNQFHCNSESSQFDLFPEPTKPAASVHPLARRTDPASSHAAAKEAIDSGAAVNQMRELVTWLRGHGGFFTSLEISRFSNMDRYNVARRLPALERAGFVERGKIRACSITGRPSIEWRAR